MPQTDYTAMTDGLNLIMPLNCEVSIEKNAPARLLNAITERMDSSKLYAAYAKRLRHDLSVQCKQVSGIHDVFPPFFNSYSDRFRILGNFMAIVHLQRGKQPVKQRNADG